jgi:hypothetical protein
VQQTRRSVSCRGQIGVQLVVLRQSVHQRLACFVHADDLHGSAMMAELQHDSIQRVDPGDVPEMGGMHVDHYRLQLLTKVEGIVEGLGRGEENLTRYAVRANPFTPSYSSSRAKIGATS